MTRLCDILFSVIGLLLCTPLLLVLTLLGLLDNGAPLFFQERVGRNQQPFTIVKFRTMRINTEPVATHLVDASAVTRLGRILRITKLDELPQLWNVLRGEMSLVGPRPCLFSQQELIAERLKRDVFNVLPGITGLAQIEGIDMSTPQLLAETDAKMLRNYGFCTYIMLILKTVIGKGLGDRVMRS